TTPNFVPHKSWYYSYVIKRQISSIAPVIVNHGEDTNKHQETTRQFIIPENQAWSCLSIGQKIGRESLITSSCNENRFKLHSAKGADLEWPLRKHPKEKRKAKEAS
ncbi:7813_t:CDS:2, partial [Funneliformis mosseae]